MTLSSHVLWRMMLWYAGVFAVAVAGAQAGLYLMSSGPAYLQAGSEYLEVRSEPPVPQWSEFSNADLPIYFMYPRRWEAAVSTSEDGDVSAQVGTVTIAHVHLLAEDDDGRQLAAESLNENADQLMSWSGKVGNVDGKYWARRGEYAGTEAPYGPRVFVAPLGETALVISLQHPPYTVGEEELLDTFKLL